MNRAAPFLSLLILAVSPALAQDEAVVIDRLAGMGRLWGAVRYFHPALATRDDLDWDAAATSTVPDVRASRTREEYEAALRKMLSGLGDPLTRVEASQPPPVSASRTAAMRLTDDDTLLLTIPDPYALNSADARRALADALEALPGAKAVVLDLRAMRPIDPYGRAVLLGSLEAVERALIATDVARPGQRRLVYYGYQSFSAFSSGQYRSGLFTEASSPLRKASTPPGVDRPLLAILNRFSVIPTSLIPRQAMGRATIVFEGSREDAAFGETMEVRLGDGLRAQVRISEAVHPDGTSAELEPDLIVPAHAAGQADSALDAALAAAARFRASQNKPKPLRATAILRPDRSYSELKSPPITHRVLAAFRFWNAVTYFYPHRELLDGDWDDALPAILRDFIKADDAVAYGRAVAAAAKRLHDGHAYVAGGDFERAVIGDGYPPLRVRLVENTPVITAIYDATAAADAGVAIGDVVVEVDGEKAMDRLARYKELFSASTPQGLSDRATLSFMNGPIGSKVGLLLRRANGAEHLVQLARRREDFNTLYHRERAGEVVRVLPGNIGYVDLDRLGFNQVDTMFERLRDTAAIVFDMRGYPNGTAWAIAPRLTDKQPIAALFRTPMPGHQAESVSSQAFVQRVGRSTADAGRYSGRTVMLIDERSQSQAEHTGMLLKAANATVFVGSPTSGANGEITTMSLPGGVTVGFTGQSVTWPDGRRLQGIGLLPDVEARPTLQGVREGRDDVLDAALRYLVQRK